MPDELIIRHCSPTLAGLKTSNLIRVPFQGENAMIREVVTLNQVLSRRGLRAILLHYSQGTGLIYLFRPSALQRDLEQPQAKHLLMQAGYMPGDIYSLLVQLCRRFKDGQTFPHEIGLFLGYPPADVEAYMAHPSEGVKFSGFWKVYTDEDKAKATFASYRKCMRIYQKVYEKGRTLEQLIVPCV